MEEKSRSLISIVKDFHALDELLIENEGELDATLEQWMQINQDCMAEKIDNYKLYIEHLDSRDDYFKNIKEQCNNAQKVFKNQIQRMKDNIENTMAQLGVDELKGEMFRFALSKPTFKVKIVNESEIPMEFMREQVTFVPDMEKIQKAIDEGQIVAGVELSESRSLRSYANTKGKKNAKKTDELTSPKAD